MKRFLSILIAAAIIGFLTFLILNWIFSIDKSTSIIWAVTIFATGLLLELFKPLFIEIDKKQKKDIEKRVTHNLGKRNSA